MEAQVEEERTPNLENIIINGIQQLEYQLRGQNEGENGERFQLLEVSPANDVNSDNTQRENSEAERFRSQVEINVLSDLQSIQREHNQVIEHSINNGNLAQEHIVIDLIQNVNDVQILNEVQVHLQNNISVDTNLSSLSGAPLTPPSTKKRKRSKSKTPKVEQSVASTSYDDENDNGATCPICLDEWEMSGLHRLTSLKCGHLFGHSCIKRWLKECAPGTKCCPSCKTKANARDLRFIYAKRICAVDKSEEYHLKELLETEKNKTMQLKADYGIATLELAMAKNQISKLEAEIERLKRMGGLRNLRNNFGQSSRSYRLFMEKNIEISKEAGCRVMLYSQQTKNLIVSQKSNQNLFPGYGVRFINVNDFRPLNFLHMSSKSIRDLCMNSTEDLLLSATQEKTAKLYNIYDRTIVSVFTPSDKPLWACTLDKDLDCKFVYLGSQTGTTFVYDIRQSSVIMDEYKVEGDLSPVVKICSVPNSDVFPYGGLLICKLQSIWFLEYTIPEHYVSTKLNVDGPFISMSYDSLSGNILISTRPSTKYSASRYIIAKLVKLNDITLLEVVVTFIGSKVTAVMSRCSQLVLNDTTLVAAYLQDVKLLSIWDSEKNSRIQSLSVADVVYDTCPIMNNNEIYVAALTECKCRIYKVMSTEKL